MPSFWMMDCNPAIAEEYLALPACKRLLTTIYGYVMEVATKEETNETSVSCAKVKD